MTIDTPGVAASRGAFSDRIAVRSDTELLRAFVVAAGLCWGVAFVFVGLRHQLHMFGDGSIFTYGVAVQDAWAFHWHNISGRLFVYLYSHLPAEMYVALTRDARGGIALYGFLHFVAPLLGLAATFAADRSRGRTIFLYACASTACVCPLVFGFPTEMWLAHALFWPALALCHYAPRGFRGSALIFAALLALVLTHGGAVVLAVSILVGLTLRGLQDGVLLRSLRLFAAAMAIWLVVLTALPPDAYISGVLANAAFNFIDVRNLAQGALPLLIAALAGYAATFLLARRLMPANAEFCVAAAVAAGLAIYWTHVDAVIDPDSKYLLRTALFVATPVLGGLAAAFALRADGALRLPVPLLPSILTALSGQLVARAAAGGLALTMLMQTVQTAIFVHAWTDYVRAVQTLAMSQSSDVGLGSPLFVSSERIPANLSATSWASTTHFLSVLVAPQFRPARLVVNPNASYFWLSCATATASHKTDRAIPSESRRLVRLHACLHR